LPTRCRIAALTSSSDRARDRSTPRTAAGAVQVVVHQPRDHRQAAKVDSARIAAGTRTHSRIVADGDDAFARDRDGAGDGEAAIDRDHAPVEEHQVSGRCGRGLRSDQRGRACRGHERAGEAANHLIVTAIV
jgi:hypothetical protein